MIKNYPSGTYDPRSNKGSGPVAKQIGIIILRQ